MARIPIGVQLYSVRNEFQNDPAGTIAAVGKMGYDGVEFAGYADKSAKELRTMLDDAGVKCCGTHLGLEALLGDELQKTVEFNQTLGNKFLICPGLPGEYRTTRAGWRRAAEILNEVADKLAPLGMKTGYHNHWIEFEPVEGELPWDTLFGAAKPEVVMQFDIGNACHAKAGADTNVVTYLKRYPGRSDTIHVKPYKKGDESALIGEDDLDWPAILAACEQYGNTQWYIVEYEVPAYPPLEAVERCLKSLKAMGK